MVEFAEAQRSWTAARAAADAARSALVRANERQKRAERELRASARGGQGAASDKLTAALRQAQAAVREARSADTEARRALDGAARAFAAFTDPAAAVARMPDDTPFALFPLRLETRYLTRSSVEGRSARFLCVRVFPDDILVDTFQPEISENELTNVRVYWTHVWRAGGDLDGRRAAWVALAKSHGAGRAHWLVQQVAPSNPTDEPHAASDEHVLVILPSVPVPPAEQAPIRRFWQRMWSSSGAERDAAFSELAAALTPARASEVEAELVPENLLDPAVKPDPTVHPLVAFLDLPDRATLPLSQADWTRPARSWLLPERFVLLGFRAGEEVVRVVGEPVPPELQVGPDPSAPDDEQLRADGDDLAVPDALKWLVDFDDARQRGLGFQVPLQALGTSPNLDLLLVLGVRAGSDATRGAAELTALLRAHQNSRKGCEILPQGRPTNNTDTSNAGYSWWEDPAASFRHFFESDTSDDPLSWRRRKDGAWLAGMLGLDAEVLRASPNYYGTDQAEARAMNAALWPATAGYYMEQLLGPVFSEQTVRATRSFFHRFVSGRGTVPLLRVGRQPYGILPTTVWSRLEFWSDKEYERVATASDLPGADYLASLHGLTERLASLWRNWAGSVSHVAAAGSNAAQTLLDVVGLHPGTAELYQRYSQSFTQHYNLLGFATQPVSEPVAAEARRYVAAGLLALEELGYTPPPDGSLPRLLELVFLKSPNLLKGELVQANASDTTFLAPARADGQNYIAWLQTAARTSHDVLRRQEGFTNGPPSALLYLLLRHAVDLGYVDTALALRRTALAWSDAQYLAERREPGFIQIETEGGGESRWSPLYRPAPEITGDPARNLGDVLVSLPAPSRPFQEEQLAALDVLKVASTGALERALLEHLDCLSYRFDAWRSGIQAVQLSYLRRETDNGFGRGGVLLGAYGWVENLKPKTAAPEAVSLDADTAALFDEGDAPPLVHDPSNLGFIHAPSLDHAVTAAILRNGYVANASADAPDLLAIELTSKRVRQAEQVLEGIRNGQSLGALLGYQLERALHDVPNLFLDRLVYALRAAFPLAGNRNRRTRVASLADITSVEARNVVDGEALLDHLERTRNFNYPYSVTGLPPLSEFTGPGLPSAAQIGAIIDGCVGGLRVVADAVADLGVAEGVYQLVRSNYDRAAGVADAISKGGHPPVLEVSSTPRGGRTLTHRLALHLAGGVPPASGGPRPRERGEPALALWLASQLPAPANVFARVSWREAAVTAGTLTPSMAALGLGVTDLFYLLEAGSEREFAAFDELLIDFAERSGAPPSHVATFELEYKPDGVAGLTLFELAPLARAMRELVLGARPLRASDLSRQSDASRDEDAGVVVRTDKAQAVLALLQARRPALNSFITALTAAVGEGVAEEAARDAARDQVDQWLVDYATAVRPFTAFGLPAGGVTAGVEGRRPRLQALLDALDEIIARWQRKQNEFDGVMADYAALPGGSTDDERVALLLRAARLVSSSVPANVAPIANLELAVTNLRTAFDAGLTSLTGIRAASRRVGATLQALSAFLPAYAARDLTPLDLTSFRASVRALADDLLRRASLLAGDVATRVDTATNALALAATATGEKAHSAVLDAARAVLGSSFQLLPEFKLAAERRAEWAAVWADRATLLAHLTSGPQARPYPVDDWLHGLARVRERMRALELVTLLGGVLGASEPLALVPLQFPHQPTDAWLGLDFPTTAPDGSPFVLADDKLLYTAVFGPGAELATADPSRTYSGLLVDEWIEVIPADQATTGLAFHFDRPNSEAPQAVLLVTPPARRGTWQFQDLVDALRETLEFARFRAVEPAQLDQSALGPLVPATLSAVTLLPITAMLNFALNNGLSAELVKAQP